MSEPDPSSADTLTEDELAKTLGVAAATLLDVARTVEQNPRSTIEPHRDGSVGSGQGALLELGARRDQRGLASGLEMGRTIGEGGMGIVRVATQRSLGREVAVKTLRPDVRGDAAALRLLREAWVTGSLEHPNIVPVYDLGLDESGAPLIVLKRIEGMPWSTHIRDAAVVRERYGATDLLEYNLRILLQLCNAVSLAHTRGVLHRDLKPENVMIGSFGEVYLVDWGIAVSLKDDETGRLPLASKATDLAGTPCYMAPEMLGTGGPLSERTDVYLLGAILHEILTGEPPHKGVSFRALVASVLLSQFDYPAEVPRELAEIARRAMSRDPEDRYASAEELRLRVEWYLRHRGSLALAAEAQRRLDEMSVVLRDVTPDRDRVYRLFAEARFGFRQALDASLENELAADGLRAAISAVTEFELERGTPEAAAAALAELSDPPAELAARVSAALRARDEERRRVAHLEELGRELDPTIGRRTRLAVTGFLGLLWTVAPQLGHYLEHQHQFRTPRLMYLWTLMLVGTSAPLALWGRESLVKTVINRRVIATGMITFAGQLALEVGAQLLGLPFAAAFALHPFLYFVTLSAAAAFLDRRLWFAAVAFLAGFLVSCVEPGIHWHVMSATNFALLLNFVVAWGALGDPEAKADARAWRERRRRAREGRGR